MPEPANARNAYSCLACGLVVGTINRDEGVTPMFLRCRNPNGCGDKMVSFGYRLPPDAPAPTLEWYRPSKAKTRRLRPEERDHVERGGLLLRDLVG